MFQVKEQEQFLELVRAGLWADYCPKILAHGTTVDWKEVYQLAEEQSVMGLVAAGLDRFKVLDSGFKVPQEWVLQFIGSSLQIEQQNKEMNAFVARLIDKLRKDDVYAILIKGQGVAQCYEKPLWRSSGDIDLLLSDSNYEKSKKVLFPLTSNIEKEYSFFKHQGMTIGEWVVELHGTMYSRLSKRIDSTLDEVQRDVFFGGNVRSWMNGNTIVFLPGPNQDVLFVFTHILHHYFFEGIGLRQICDWCRLLWTYRSEIDVNLLEKRLKKMGLMTEWKAFAAFVVNFLGMPVEAMPLYSSNRHWKKKAVLINQFVLKVGNFGHKYRRNYEGKSYLVRKYISFWGRLSDILRHFAVFPKDSILFFGGVVRSGLHAALRGE